MSKGFNETLPTYGGVYGGGASNLEIKKYVESSDAIVYVGRFASDFNTGEFTAFVDEQAVIEIQRFWLSFSGGEKVHVSMKHTLNALARDFEKNPLQHVSGKVDWDPYSLRPKDSGALNQDYLWAVSTPLAEAASAGN
jgi:TPP-dependent 2-oxoacid decarboxylase